MLHRGSSSESRLQALERENSKLHAENEGIRAAYYELAHAVPTLLALTSNPFGLPVPQDGHNLTPTPPTLNQANFPLIRFWHRADFGKSDGVSQNTGANPRGATLVSQGINVTGQYIEDANGVVVDGFRLSAMMKVAGQIWFGFVGKGTAPRTWGQASLDVITLYNNEMCRQFPELRYCADNWKAQRLATANYSSWYTTHGTEKPAGKKPARKQRRASRSPASHPEGRKKVKLDEDSLIPLHPMWDPPLVPGPDSIQPVVREMPDTVPESEATPAGAVVDVPAPSPPSAAPQQNTIQPVEPVDAAAAAAPALSTGTETATETPAPSPHDAAAVHAALVATAFPPQLPPPIIAPAAVPPAATAASTTKKDAKMTANASMTARNLCSKMWIGAHHGTRVDFGSYWDRLRGTQAEVYWNLKSAEAKGGPPVTMTLPVDEGDQGPSAASSIPGS
ncbi:hypothetical protein C8R46DRAFT_1239453 [Mycena filopes]|nr:hypothetical protein C8R46DRAFT_1239453 [Mycena filopes]